MGGSGDFRKIPIFFLNPSLIVLLGSIESIDRKNACSESKMLKLRERRKLRKKAQRTRKRDALKAENINSKEDGQKNTSNELNHTNDSADNQQIETCVLQIVSQQ